MAKRKTNSATIARLRALRQKYGLGEFKKSSSTNSYSKKRGAFMARRKGRSRFKSFASASAKPLTIAVSGMAYGAGRAWLNEKLAPLTSKIPLGNISDEVGLFGLHYLLHRYVKNKMVKQVTLAGMAVESALIGQELKNNGFGMSNTSSSSSSSASSFS